MNVEITHTLQPTADQRALRWAQTARSVSA